MGFLDINLEMYSDSDVSLNHYKYSLIKGNEHYFNKIRVHYNIYDGEKDFGVPLSRIKEKIYKLKWPLTAMKVVRGILFSIIQLT